MINLRKKFSWYCFVYVLSFCCLCSFLIFGQLLSWALSCLWDDFSWCSTYWSVSWSEMVSCSVQLCSCAVVGCELKGSFHSWGEMRERAGSLQPLIQHTTTQAPPTHSNALSMTPGSKTETQNLKQIYKASFSGWIPHILNHKQLSNFPK